MLTVELLLLAAVMFVVLEPKSTSTLIPLPLNNAPLPLPLTLESVHRSTWITSLGYRLLVAMVKISEELLTES